MSSINRELKEYIEREILPLYLSFDKAHNTDHAEAVISRSLELATAYDVDIDMVYAIAAFHDTGLKFGRELHHIHSGEILAADAFILGHFTAEQIETMCQAVEDHRASSKEAPRSIYGRIVAEADRCIDSMTVIRRTIQYGLANFCIRRIYHESSVSHCLTSLHSGNKKLKTKYLNICTVTHLPFRTYF